jgi:hypothetical protein
MFTGDWNLLPQSAKLVTTKYYFQKQYGTAFNNLLAVGGKCSYGHLAGIFISLSTDTKKTFLFREIQMSI